MTFKSTVKNTKNGNFLGMGKKTKKKIRDNWFFFIIFFEKKKKKKKNSKKTLQIEPKRH